MNAMKTSNKKQISFANILKNQVTERDLNELAKGGSRVVCNQLVAISDLAKALGKSERTLRRDLKEIDCSELILQVGRRKYILFGDFVDACKQYMKAQEEKVAELEKEGNA